VTSTSSFGSSLIQYRFHDLSDITHIAFDSRDGGRRARYREDQITTLRLIAFGNRGCIVECSFAVIFPGFRSSVLIILPCFLAAERLFACSHLASCLPSTLLGRLSASHGSILYSFSIEMLLPLAYNSATVDPFSLANVRSNPTNTRWTQLRHDTTDFY